jgi:hypothetical protein
MHLGTPESSIFWYKNYVESTERSPEYLYGPVQIMKTKKNTDLIREGRQCT